MEDLGAIGEITGPAPRLQHQLSSGGPNSATKFAGKEMDFAIRTEDNAPVGFENVGGELDKLEEEKLGDATFVA